MLSASQNIFGVGCRVAVGVMLFAWLTLVSQADQSYVVKRNDTLYGIARRHNVTVAHLADRNGLTKDARIYVGQRLIIPTKSAAVLKRPAVSPPVQNAIDRAPVTSGRWKYIVVHHSGVNTGTMKSLDRYHREERHMENGLAYHFVIGNGSGMGDGEIGVGSRWTKQLDGGHLASLAQNKVSLGICLIGNFDQKKPTAKQMQSLTALTEALMKRSKLSPSAVKTHQQINVLKTRCPGRYFPTSSFLKGLKPAK
jgi:LysM repeat protein